jgi:hypothetical protein
LPAADPLAGAPEHKGLLDFLELVSYFFSFWLFLGSPGFRAQTLAHWRSMKRGWAILIVPIEIASSVFCGVVIPGYILHLIAIG